MTSETDITTAQRMASAMNAGVAAAKAGVAYAIALPAGGETVENLAFTHGYRVGHTAQECLCIIAAAKGQRIVIATGALVPEPVVIGIENEARVALSQAAADYITAVYAHEPTRRMAYLTDLMLIRARELALILPDGMSDRLMVEALRAHIDIVMASQ